MKKKIVYWLLVLLGFIILLLLILNFPNSKVLDKTKVGVAIGYLDAVRDSLETYKVNNEGRYPVDIDKSSLQVLSPYLEGRDLILKYFKDNKIMSYNNDKGTYVIIVESTDNNSTKIEATPDYIRIFNSKSKSWEQVKSKAIKRQK